MLKPLRPTLALIAGGLLTLVVPRVAFAQVGPFVSPGDPPASPLPKEDRQREAMARARAQAAIGSATGTDEAAPAAATTRKQAPLGKLTACLSTIDANAEGAAAAARTWLAGAKGRERAEAGQCLGSALVALERFGEARDAFVASRDAVPVGDHASRARLGAMAGNAALAGGDAGGALAALDVARADAGVADKALASGISTDRARALVALKRTDEAATALAEARTIVPDDAEAWLLSATLSRRTNKLADAQAQIEKAAALIPGTRELAPDIGLEAGVIAMLSGHPDTARKTWQSVLAAAPQSASAAAAQGYLAQLGADGAAPAQAKPAQDKQAQNKEASR